MKSLLVKNIILDNKTTSIYCEKGKIASIGVERPADTVLDGRGFPVHPPFINSHTHAAMTLFRGNGDDLPLMEWLQTRIWPYEQTIKPEEVYWGTKLAIVEMIHSGITYFVDMYWDFHQVARAVEEMGIRACLSAVFIDFDQPEFARQQRETNERLFSEMGRYSDHVTFAIAPHAIYTVSEESLLWAGEFTRRHNLYLHTHLSETQKEVQDCRDAHGCTPVEYLHRLNLLSDRLVAAHTVILTERDIELLGSHRVLCVHNPVSNMKLAVGGVYPYRKLKESGAIPALATDGAGSNNNLDILEDMKIAALLQKHHQQDPTALPAPEVMQMATTNPAHFFKYPCDTIHLGGPADFILLNTHRPEMIPMHNLVSHLVYSANSSVVDSVVCDGKVLMEHGVIEGEEEILMKAAEAAKQMFGRVDFP